VKRIRIQRPRARRERPWGEALPLDPRDPDVVRVKALVRAANPRRRVTGRAVTVPGPADASGSTPSGSVMDGRRVPAGCPGPRPTAFEMTGCARAT
jgi:hypothetical protein